MGDFIDLIKEGFRLAANVGAMAYDAVKAAVVGYFRQVKKWSIRFFIAALVPLVVVVPCMMFRLPLGWLYGTYVVYFVLLVAAELVLVTPMFLVWRRVKAVFPTVASDLADWVDFIKNVVFNGLSLGIFVTLVPVWRSPGALPLLLLVVACWLTLPACSVSSVCKRIYPAVRAVQLLLLFALLALQMVFPRQLEQLSWLTGRKIGSTLIASVNQNEITSQWKDLQWFDNAGEPLVYVSGSEAEGYRLWATPGFDTDSREELRPVKDKRMRDHVVARLEANEARLQNRARIQQQQDQERNAKAQEMAAKQTEEQAAQKAREAAELARREAEQRRVEKQARYFAQVPELRPGVEPRVVVVAANQRETDSKICAAASSLAGRSGYAVAAGLLKPEFVSDGLFENAFNGRWDSLSDLNLSERCEFLALCQFVATSENRPAFQNAKSASGKLTLTLVNSATGSKVFDQTFEVSATAFDTDKAIGLVREKMVALLATNALPQVNK
jgi:hypothetical protein